MPIVDTPRTASRYRRFASWITTLLAVTSSGCSSSPDFLAWPEVETDRITFQTITEGGELLVVRGPFGEGLGLDPLPRSNELLRPSAELHLIELDPNTIGRDVSVLRLDHLSELRLERDLGSCRALEYAPNLRRLSLGAKHGRARVLAGDEFQDEPLSDLSLALVVPLDEDWCLPKRVPALEPFGLTPKLLAAGAPPMARPPEDPSRARQLHLVTELGPDRLLAASTYLLFVFERGASWVEDPSRYWDSSLVAPLDPDGHWTIDGLLVEEPVPSGATRILVMLEWRGNGDPGPSQLMELTWSTSGFSAATLLYQGSVSIPWLGRLPDGRIAAAGQTGLLLVSSGDGRSMIELTGTDLEQDSLRAGAVGPTPSEPLVLLDARHGLHFGEPRSNARFRSEPSPWSLTGARILLRFDAGDGLASYVNDTGGPELMLRRGETGARELWHPAVPAGLEYCGLAANDCGERLTSGDRPAVSVTDHTTLVVSSELCEPLIEVHPFRRCSRAIRVSVGQSLDELQVRGTFVHGDRLTVFGADGLLLQGEWAD